MPLGKTTSHLSKDDVSRSESKLPGWNVKSDDLKEITKTAFQQKLKFNPKMAFVLKDSDLNSSNELSSIKSVESSRSSINAEFNANTSSHSKPFSSAKSTLSNQFSMGYGSLKATSVSSLRSRLSNAGPNNSPDHSIQYSTVSNASQLRISSSDIFSTLSSGYHYHPQDTQISIKSNTKDAIKNPKSEKISRKLDYMSEKFKFTDHGKSNKKSVQSNKNV